MVCRFSAIPVDASCALLALSPTVITMGVDSVPYLINDEIFATKTLVTERCRQILKRTPDGCSIGGVNAEFLFCLFLHHDEWAEKSSGGVSELSAQTTIHGTRCFVVRSQSGAEIDISFSHAVRLMPNSRSASLVPQKLRDFRNGARTAVQDQIRDFRDKALVTTSSCSITGENLSRSNSAVDHVAPDTFDQLLFKFCHQYLINPLNVRVGSLNGVVAVIEDERLSFQWQEFHRQHARLRIVSRMGNLQLSKAVVPWSQLYE